MLAIRALLILLVLSLGACKEPDSIWTDAERRILASFRLERLDSQPESFSNRFALTKDAIQFGKQIFFDARFSLNQRMSCASCHQPEKYFTDSLSKAQGIKATGRNTQTLIGASHQTWFYWDGRKDSLWAQALVPFEAADEMASSRLQVLRIIGQDKQYRQRYEQLFGEFPQKIYQANLPEHAGPLGDAERQQQWYRIPLSMQQKINMAYANIGKAVAAYVRSIPIPQTRFDNYLEILHLQSEAKAQELLTEEEIAGLRLFIDQKKTHCIRCHNGPMFSNGEFHNIGSGTFSGQHLDFGRYFGVQTVVQDEFNCLGAFSDAEPEQCTALRYLPKQIDDQMQGAYKTPTLRYLGTTAPYFHDGRYASLDEVLKHYLEQPENGSELPAIELTQEEQAQLLAFMKTLN